MSGGMGNSPLVPQEHDIVLRICHIPGKFNILVDSLLRLDRPLNTEWSLDQLMVNCIFQMLNFPSMNLFVTQFNHKFPLYVSPGPDNQALAIYALSVNWNICISTNNSDTFCSSQDMSISVQNSSYCTSLASTSMVHRGVTMTSISPDLSSVFFKIANTSKRRNSNTKISNL